MISDADLLALCVWTEAQNQPADGMAAVVRVVLNRLRLHYSSDGTIPGTILHHGAFSAFGFDWSNGAYHPAPDAYTPERCFKMLEKAQLTPAIWSKCCRVVISVQAGHYVGDVPYDKLTADTLLYDNLNVSHPVWAIPAAFVTKIGDHSFYKDLTRHA